MLGIIATLPHDLHVRTLMAVLNQTHPVAMVLILPAESSKSNVAEKVSEVLNEGFGHIHLEDFDYILRVDGDTILPTNFVAENLKDEPDICGQAGYALLFRVKPFLSLLGGNLNPESDDSYITAKFLSAGLKVTKWKVRPILLRKSGGSHGCAYYLHRGKVMYKLGYEPVHVFASILNDKKNVFAIAGYIRAWFKRETYRDVFPFIRNYQVRRLFRG